MPANQDNSEIVKKILSGARWATALRLIAQSVSWLCTIFVVRFISQEDYGLNAMLESPLEFLFLLSTFGLDTALVRAHSVRREELQSTFGWLLLINGALFLAYFFGSTLIAAYFNEPRLESLAKVLAFVFLIVPFRVIPNALLDRELKFKLKAFAELATSIVTSIVTLILAMLGAGIWALITGVILARTMHMVLLMILQPWFMRPRLVFSEVRGLMSFGGTMTLASAIAVTGYMLPAMIAGPRLGPEALGVFAVSLQFALLPLAKVMPVIQPIIFPAFSKFQGQRAAVAGYMEKSIGFAALILLPPMVGLACVSREFVPVVLGEKWLAAAIPLALLSLSVPFRGLTSFVRQVMGGVGYAGLTLKSTAITWIVFFSLIVIGVNHGVPGLVTAVLVTEPLIAIVTIGLCKQAMDTSYSRIARALIPAVSCCTLMSISVLGAREVFSEQSKAIMLSVEVIIGAIVYVAALRILFSQQFADAIRLIKR